VVCAARRENMVLKTCRFEHSAKHKLCPREQPTQETSILQRHQQEKFIVERNLSREQREYKCGRETTAHTIVPRVFGMESADCEFAPALVEVEQHKRAEIVSSLSAQSIFSKVMG
jgi:hypothetical protein